MRSVTVGKGTESTECRQNRMEVLDARVKVSSLKYLDMALQLFIRVLCILQYQNFVTHMSLRDQECRKSNVQNGRIMKSRRHVMVAHDMTSDEDCFLLRATTMSVDLSKLVIVSTKTYGEPLDNPVCVCGFEDALSAGHLIGFW